MKFRRLETALAALGAFACGFAARSAAADAPLAKRPVFVERTACEVTPLGELTSILRVELYGRLVEERAPADAYRATIDCSGRLVAIRVVAPGGANQSLQTDLASVPANVRARIVALDVAELVRALDGDARDPPPAAPPAPPRDVAPNPRRPPASSRTHRVGLAAFGEASAFPQSGVWLGGGGLRFDLLFRRFCAGFDVTLLTADEGFTQGTVHSFLAYAAPALAWRDQWGPAEMRLGAAYAFGAARLSGRASDARAFAGTTTGPWTAPYLFLAFALALTDTAHLDLRGLAGWVSSPVVGEVVGSSDLSLEGPWMSAQLGLSLAL